MRPRSGELSFGLGNKALAELPFLERDSSAMKTSHAVKPANIRVINRRRTGPISGCALEEYLTAILLYNGGGETVFSLTTVSHIRPRRVPKNFVGSLRGYAGLV
jgi:hypothetical protein